ncbi:peptide chain release factor N(5)-glutamine methyltransferase [Macrococcus equipercicus]|uniref:Release factor glutamine methyltransferase n=1 Tax=Macrococcus equipercicus TaxID=69967 RepID=A0A9Q9BV61_9STAP|nr:peptide chain release factor N(5)-glutamine methyltransferase [Macrococcus equipercicus]UTH13553.1 peptide chain release factor N(5)-glutamine methyltransferase [Macrococcus equipercicus]
MVCCKPAELVKAGSRTLSEAGQPPVGALFLMMDLFDLSQLAITLGSRTLSHEEAARYAAGIQALCRDVPLAHITGFQEFYGRRFNVTADTLVPRPETEELVLKVLSTKRSGVAADIGTGTGCIAVTLELEGDYTVHGTDISTAALAIARENARALGSRVNFHHGDLLEPLIASNIKLDILVSNPPYIAASERALMTQSVLGHDPHLALFADDDGLALYKRMIEQLPRVMKDNGYVFFEIGHSQGPALTNYITERYNVTVHVEQDINQLDRILWFNWCE